MFELRPRWAVVAAVMALAAAVLGGAAVLRGVEYDEGYTVFLATGVAQPEWPSGVFRAGDVRGVFAGHSSAAGIARDLRAVDVHPPLYFWSVAAWRGVVGTGLTATRAFSVVCALGGLAAVGVIARLGGVPPVAAMLLTLGCYGFAYTASIARGFALAGVLALSGVAVLLGRRGGWSGLGGGVLLGLASFANYLAAFTGAGALAWMVLRDRRRAVWAVLGFAAVLPGDLWFFLAQRGSREGQFPVFQWGQSFRLLAKYAGANVFGGLPLYAGDGQVVVAAALGCVVAGLAGLVVWRWRVVGTAEARLLFALMAVATPVGLLALGVVFNNTPIELRYVSFAVPPAMLLVAGAIASVRWRGVVLGGVLGLQALAIAGLLTRAETSQPQAGAARAAFAAAGADGLVLVPYGHDGVGVLSAVVSALPDAARVLAVRVGDAGKLGAGMAGYSRVALVLTGLDWESRAALFDMEAAVAGGCWRAGARGADVAVFDREC